MAPSAQPPPPPCILLTGALGFVGSAIVRAVRDTHPTWRVVGVDLAPTPVPSRQAFSADIKAAWGGPGWESRVVYRQCDVTDPRRVEEVFGETQPDAVVHCAGIVPALRERYSRRTEREVKRVNVEGTRAVVDAAVKYGCRALVYTSSCTVVTDDFSRPHPYIDEAWPTTVGRSTVYAESKIVAEAVVLGANGRRWEGLARERHPRADDDDNNNNNNDNNDREQGSHGPILTCVLRPAVVFGEGDTTLIPAIHSCIANGETRYRLGSCANLWDTVYVGNLADAHVLAVENLLSSSTVGLRCQGRGQDSGERLPSAAGEAFFIQNNEPVTFREFTLAVWREYGHCPPWPEISIPAGLAWVAGLCAEGVTQMLGLATSLSRGSVMDACAVRYACGDKANRILAYEPKVGLEEGLSRSCMDYARRLGNKHGSCGRTVEEGAAASEGVGDYRH